MFTEASFTKKALSSLPHFRLATLRVLEDLGETGADNHANSGGAGPLVLPPAGAGLISYNRASFFTAPADGTLTFIFEGYSAGDTDQMVFAFNGDTLMSSLTTSLPRATWSSETVGAGQIYQLGLRNNSAGDRRPSDPASHWDRQLHLASTSTFSDFHLGSSGANAREHGLCASSAAAILVGKTCRGQGPMTTSMILCLPCSSRRLV